MSDYNLGTARGVIEIDYRGNGAQNATRDLRNAGGAADDASQRMDRAGNALAGAGVAIVAGFGVAIKAAADFEQRLSAVKAVSGATDAEMEMLRNKALQLGKDTQFSASESAAAIEELVKAGLSVEDVMAGAADATVALAAAGGVDMPTAAALASNAMNQFNLSARDLVGVADTIAGAANASAIDVGELGQSLQQVGAVANLAGVNFEDTATAIALLGNAGIKGSDAGTSLKSMFSNLQPDTAKTTAMFKELGIVTEDGANKFYDAEGNMKSLSDVSGILANSLEGMSAKQKQATLQVLFGSDGIRAAAILANNGSKGFDKMAKSMGKVSAADVAATRMDNLKGSFEQFMGSVETLMIVIGTPLLGVLRDVVDGVTSLLNIFLNLPGPVQRAIGIFLAVLGPGLLLVGLFMKVRAAIMAGQFALLGLTAPIFLVVAAVAAAVAAFAYFYNTSDRFRAIVDTIAGAVRDYLIGAITAALPYIQQIGDFLVSTFQAALPYIISFMGWIQQMATLFMTNVWPAIVQVAGIIQTALLGALAKIQPEIMPLVQAFMEWGRTIMSVVIPVFRVLIAAVGAWIAFMIGKVWPVLIRVGGFFTKIFIGVIGNAVRTALTILRGVINIMSGVIKVFVGILTGNWRKAWEGVKQIIRGAATAVGGIFRGIFDNAKTIIGNIRDALVAGVKAIPGKLRALGGMFKDAGKWVIDQFADGIKNAAGLIQGIASNVWGFVRGLLNGAISRINSALQFSINPPGPGSVYINPPDIPMLASGGVVRRATMLWAGEGQDDEAITPLGWLEDQIERVYLAGLTRRHDTEMASAPVGVGARTTTGSGRSRLVEGRLSIDSTGRAWITGIAEDLYEGYEEFDATHGRMN